MKGSISPEVVEAVFRTYFFPYARKVFHLTHPGKAFLNNWHLEALAWKLERFLAGDMNRLLVTIPPRSLKSTFVSVAFPTFLLGHDPTLNIVCVSYSDELAIKFANQRRAILQSAWFRRLFPACRINPKKNTEIETETTKGGFVFSTSVAGTLTGRGGDLIILDDPMKQQDALSKSFREQRINWFQETVLSRLNHKARSGIIVVMQRLHSQDLAGHLLETGKWGHLNLPAIAPAAQTVQIGEGRYIRRKADQLLHPARESLPVLRKLEREMGKRAFSAQYNQQPIPETGEVFKREDIRFYGSPPPKEPGDLIIQSWDTAAKTGELNDYSVGLTIHWRRKPGEFYIFDVFRDKLRFPELKAKLREQYSDWNADCAVIEDAGSGIVLIQELKDLPLNIKGVKPEGDKVVRSTRAQLAFEAGKIFLPRKASWVEVFVAELLEFPDGAHDDQVDGLSHAVNWAETRRRRDNGDPMASAPRVCYGNGVWSDGYR